MSHFSVCVITKDGDYESALAPFDESIEVEPRIDTTKAEIIEHEKKRHQEMLKGEYSENTIADYNERWGSVDFNDDEAIFNKYKELWGDEIKLDEDGNELTTYNPDSKWDWYSLGGRFSGSLRLKEGAEPIKSSTPSIFGYNDEYYDGCVDYAQVKDIDFSVNEKNKSYYERFWAINVDGAAMLKEEEESGEYRTFYRKEYYLDKYGDRDTFVKDSTAFRTYALLYNGEWFESGQMGWFGCSTETGDTYREYKQKFDEIMAGLEPDDYIAIVDCHI